MFDLRPSSYDQDRHSQDDDCSSQAVTEEKAVSSRKHSSSHVDPSLTSILTDRNDTSVLRHHSNRRGQSRRSATNKVEQRLTDLSVPQSRNNSQIIRLRSLHATLRTAMNRIRWTGFLVYLRTI